MRSLRPRISRRATILALALAMLLLAVPAAPAQAASPGTDGFVGGSSFWCDRADLDQWSKLNCERAGSPGQRYPTSHYALDNQSDSGVLSQLNPLDWMRTFLQVLCGVWWIVLVNLVRLALLLLDAAFSVDLLSGATVPKISGALNVLNTKVFGVPWMDAALAVTGIWALYGLVRSRVTETLGGMLATAAMMIAGLVVVADPAGTIVPVSHLASQAGTAVLSTASGAPGQPGSGLGAGEEQIWQDFVARPWCALEFGDARMCEDAIPGSACTAVGGTNTGRDGTCTVADLFLTTGAGSDNRNTFYHYAKGQKPPDPSSAGCTDGPLGLAWASREVGSWFGSDANKKCDQAVKDAKKALALASAERPYIRRATSIGIQDNSGALTRVPLLFVISVGVLGIIALLLWLGLRLISAAVVIVVLLLMLPLALLAPAMGETGRASAVSYAKHVGANLLSWLYYSVFLAVVVVVFQVLGTLTGGNHWLASWALQSGACLGIFANRDRVLGAVSLGMHERTSSIGFGAPLRSLQQLYYGVNLGRMAAGAVATATGLRAWRAHRLARDMAAQQAGEEAADIALRGQAAGAMAGERQERYDAARATLDRAATQRDELDAVNADLRGRRMEAGRMRPRVEDGHAREGTLASREQALTSEIDAYEARLEAARARRAAHVQALNEPQPPDQMRSAEEGVAHEDRAIAQLAGATAPLAADRDTVRAELAQLRAQQAGPRDALAQREQQIRDLEARRAALKATLRSEEVVEARRVVTGGDGAPSSREIDDAVRAARERGRAGPWHELVRQGSGGIPADEREALRRIRRDRAFRRRQRRWVR
jgi:hypothetical protein